MEEKREDIKTWDIIKSKRYEVCDFFSNHKKEIITIVLVAFIIFMVLFLVIPVKKEMKIVHLRWNWDIPIQKYTAVSRSSWDYPSKDAYDIEVKREVHHYVRINKVNVPAYKDKYYYKINEWKDSYMICNSGYDRNPYERECSIPFEVDKPKLDDERRRNVKKTYEVIGEGNGNATVTYDITEADWNHLETSGKISFKKFRFGKHIWDIEFE